jgi:hypothetical protein
MAKSARTQKVDSQRQPGVLPYFMPCLFDHNDFSKELAGAKEVFAEAGGSVQRTAVRPVGQSWFAILLWMDVERIIDDIRQLEEMFETPDIRPLSASDVSAANRRHDETLANSPWFRLWQDFGICCRPGNPMLSETERQ